MITREGHLAEAMKAVNEYDRLLNLMEETTDDLIAAIDAWDAQKVQNLIEARSDLCSQVGKSIESIAALEPEHDVASDLSAASALRKLEAVMQRAQLRHQSLLERQTQAEQKLNAELQRRRPGLAKMNERRGRQQAYAKSAVLQHSRFLDSRL